MEINFTDAAINHLESYLSRDKDAIAVRFSVRKSGCSGFRYVAETISELVDGDKQICVRPPCYVAHDSIKPLSGMEIDHKVTATGSSLVYNNPNARDICGCGESFRIIEDDEKS